MKHLLYILILSTVLSCEYSNSSNHKTVSTDLAPKAVGPYSQAVWANNTLYLSGNIAINPETNRLDTTSIEAELHQVMKNIEGILQSQNLSFNHLIKCEIFLSNLDDYKVINTLYASYFQDGYYPARTTLEVSKIPLNANIEISCVAQK